MSRPKITNSIAMIPNKSDREDLPDKESKGMVINRFKQLKDVSILQEHRHKQLNQIKKSIQNMKIEFNKKREFLKQSQKEMMEKQPTSAEYEAQRTASPTELIGHVERKTLGLESKVR